MRALVAISSLSGRPRSLPGWIAERWWLVFALALVTQTAPAVAQQQAAAEALFRSAKAAAEEGDWQTACDRFEESLRLEAAPGTLLNLARCREELGQLASAWKRYGEVAQRLPRDDPRARYAERKELELAPRVPHITLLPPRRGALGPVRVNDVEVTAAGFGIPLPVDPGPVTVSTVGEGRMAWRVQLRLREGERVEQEVLFGELLESPTPKLERAPPHSGQELARAPAPHPAPVASPSGDAGGSRSRTLPFVLFTTAAAGAATGIAGGVWAGVELSTVNQHCHQGVCDLVGYEAGARGRSAVALTAVGFSVGALSALAGYLLWNSAPSGVTEARSIEVGGDLIPGGAALVIGGTWK